MEITNPFGKLFSVTASGRSRLPCELGCIQPGFSRFGDEPLVLSVSGADEITVSGIFQKRHCAGKTVYALLRYYVPKNPNSEAQQLARQKYANGIVAWRNLTSEQKALYNEASFGKKMSGYNFFLKEYLKS